MPMRITMTTTVDRATAERLEQEAKNRKMKISPLLREVLDAHVARERGEGTAPAEAK